ncbi:MAG: aminoacyl-tRNA hydrolase [Spirochaetaceae bacterium]|jgi:PTH1 family peptidyl-tRNA hydrolase|nr:aminoacyl-tRNA hydrolase [Spirochaetaceae bacterium]
MACVPRLVVFLGNPGEAYKTTRHNAGRLLARLLPLAPQWQKKFKSLYAPVPLEGGVCHFLMPETYMNNSGQAVQAAAAYFKIPPGAVLVAHDELELPLGKAGYKFGGGLGGHNGLRSIRDHLGTADFWRLRIGIGRPGGVKEKGQDISGWVLSAFSPDEEPVITAALRECAEGFLAALENGLVCEAGRADPAPR